MLVSTKGRYALQVMVDLAEHRGEEAVSLKVIAGRQGISEKYLEGIIKLLVRARLVSGQRGKGGGYRLTRAPEEYSAREILALTEQSLSPVACLDEPGVCAQSCPTVAMWRGLDRVIREYLENVTLDDLARREGRWDEYVI